MRSLPNDCIIRAIAYYFRHISLCSLPPPVGDLPCSRIPDPVYQPRAGKWDADDVSEAYREPSDQNGFKNICPHQK
jgi:hypothetical protein